jgi:16S rRNA (guanine527-N7)-methyltransferase
MGPAPPGDRTATLEAYLDELDRWSARLNLTSIPREQRWVRNVVEVEDLLHATAPPVASRVVDIGSGGGVPGMVLAILRPDLSVTLLDSDQRKVGFLIHVAGLLGLSQVVVEALRAEDAGRREGMREAFDLATSRATAPPPVLCELALPMLRIGGSLCALVADARRLPAAGGDTQQPPHQLSRRRIASAATVRSFHGISPPAVSSVFSCPLPARSTVSPGAAFATA